MPSSETVGLCIDNNSGYVLHAKTVGAEVRILGYAAFRYALPDNPTDQDRRLLILQELKKAFSLANVKSKNISLCVPGDASMTRFFEIPILPKKDEKNAVKFEAQKFVPFDMKDLYHGYEGYPDAARKKVSVVFLAAKKKWVDDICATLKEINFKVVSVELMSQAIAKTYFFEASKDPGVAQVLIADNDDKTAELIISHGAAVLVTRHLTLTTTANAGRWDVPMLVSEIRLSFDYFSENFKSLKISKVSLLMDKTDQTQQLEDLLRSEFSVSVETIALLPSLKNDNVSVAQRSAAYGLSLSKGKSVNLMSSESVQASAPVMSWDDEKKYLQDLATKGIIGAGAVLLVIFLILNQWVSSKQTALTRLAAVYPASKTASISEPLAELKAKELTLMGKMSFVNNFFDKRTYLTPALNELPRLIPANVLLTQMKYDSSPADNGFTASTLHIEGFLLTMDAAGKELSSVNKIVQLLSDSKEFKSGFDSIKIGSTKRVTFKGAPVTRFSLDCTKTRKG